MSMNTIAAYNRVDTLKVERCDGGFDCQCCGRNIRKVHLLSTGHKVGSECAGWLGYPSYRIGRKPAAKLAAFARNLGIRV